MSMTITHGGTAPRRSPREPHFLVVGSYARPDGGTQGGISVLGIAASRQLHHSGDYGKGLEAGYLATSPDQTVVYAVDERKNDGRGPVGPAASVHSFRTADGDALIHTGSQPILGPFPTYLSVHPAGGWLVVAAHGSFDHVEHLVKTADGYAIENVYDDSTVSLYPLQQDGGIGPLADLLVLSGHGVDPGTSPQAGGHAQASAHAHCAQFDPSGEFVVVCDKGTDKIHVLRLIPSDGRLATAHVHECTPGTAPRHVAFHPSTPLLVVTNELASTLTSYRFDPSTGTLTELCTISTLAPVGCSRTNEPAEIQIHPSGRHVFVNNRGQDTIVSFAIDPASGSLAYASHTEVAASIHPGLAARSFRFDAAGTQLYFADRPADALISYNVNATTSELVETTRTQVSQPAFVLVI